MTRIYTAGDICRALAALDRKRLYGYINERTHGEIQLVSVRRPEGPIMIRRRKIGGAWGVTETISSHMLWRVANALGSGMPINVDRVLGGSYNTRSVLEALLAHTPEIYTCLPGRLENIGGNVSVKRGHKHILFDPANPHALGVTAFRELGENCVISETPTAETMYDVAPPPTRGDLAPDIARRHSQIQVALAEIGNALALRTWVAIEDHGIVHDGRNILQYPFIVKQLEAERTLSAFPEAVGVAKHIDCIQFNGGLPFVFEVEHTTGVTSGLIRMLHFHEEAPHIATSFVVVAPDEDRPLVMERCNHEQFRELNPMYLPYSSVEELYSFARRRNGYIRGADKKFLFNFLEPCFPQESRVNNLYLELGYPPQFAATRSDSSAPATRPEGSPHHNKRTGNANYSDIYIAPTHSKAAQTPGGKPEK